MPSFLAASKKPCYLGSWLESHKARRGIWKVQRPQTLPERCCLTSVQRQLPEYEYFARCHCLNTRVNFRTRLAPDVEMPKNQNTPSLMIDNAVVLRRVRIEVASRVASG
jgi:hypothetical protein